MIKEKDSKKMDGSKTIDRLILTCFRNIRISMNQQFPSNGPRLLFAVICMIISLLFVNSTMGQVVIMREKGMKKDIPVSFDSERDAMIFWVADQRLDLGKGYTNSGTFYPTLYSEQNLFNLKTRTGPLFKEVKQSVDKGRTVERYFYLTKDNEGKIVPKYIDEEVAVEKEAGAQPATGGKIVWHVIPPILSAIIVLFVLLVTLFNEIRNQRREIGQEQLERTCEKPVRRVEGKELALVHRNAGQRQATSVAPNENTTIDHYTAEGVEVPLLEFPATIIDDLLYYGYHLVRHANLLWVVLAIGGVLITEAHWIGLFIMVPIAGYPISALIRELLFSDANHLRLAIWYTKTKRLFFFNDPRQMSLKEYDKAISSDNIAIRTRGHLFRGFDYAEAQAFEKARADFESTIKLDPWNGSAFYALGHIYQEKGMNREAEEVYSKALLCTQKIIKLMENWQPGLRSFIKAKGQVWRYMDVATIKESLHEVRQKTVKDERDVSN